MANIMNWGECSENFIRHIEKDPAKVASIIETAELRLRHIQNIRTTKDNASFIVEGYYEVIKELLVALLLSRGLRSKNHQCLISYFYKSYPEYEAEVHLISQMSYLRNRLDYYGETIELSFCEHNKSNFEKIIDMIKNLINVS